MHLLTKKLQIWTLNVEIFSRIIPCNTLGHGIGLDVHELLLEIQRKTKAKNMVITIEPGIYKENKYGIRIEMWLLCR